MVRLKPDRMRSKVVILYQPMVIIARFDLISQPLRAASFPSRGSLSSEVRTRFLREWLPCVGGGSASLFLRIEFGVSGHSAAPTRKNDTAYRPSAFRADGAKGMSAKSPGQQKPRPMSAL